MEPAPTRPSREAIDHDDLLVDEWRVTQQIDPGTDPFENHMRVVERSGRSYTQTLAYLLWAAVSLLLEVIADDAPGDPDASVLTLVRDLGLAEPDRALFPALIRVALGPSEVKRSALAPGGPAWSGEPLTESETRVLRYLPTHLGASQIAAELCLSANTVKTHVRHLYLKLGVHSRREAVQRARAIGLLTGSSRWP
jgi:LuxR family transcriptional regulator, maltose regulon positive regulatory protein